MTTYTVPTTAVYRDATTGQAKRFKSGEIIPIEDAVRFGMPGAALPAAGSAFTSAQDAQLAAQEASDAQTDHVHIGATIHNYFPDGRITSAALIDTLNSGANAKLWQSNAGTETLSLSAAGGRVGENAIKIALPGLGWGEGILAADWSNTYGCGALPAGDYELSCWMRCSSVAKLYVTTTGTTGEDEGGGVTVELKTGWRHVVVGRTTSATGFVGLLAITRDADYEELDKPVVDLYCSQLMITEGDSSVYADGASDGWAWGGTAHASPSSGPQP